MTTFKFINNATEMCLPKTWVDSPEFTDKGKIVDHSGRKYRLIEKKEYTFSCMERIGRGFLGVVAVCFSLGLAFFCTCIRDLFTKKKEIICFGVALTYQEQMNDEVQSMAKIITRLKITGITDSCPPRYEGTFTDRNGLERPLNMSEEKFQRLLREVPPTTVIDPPIYRLNFPN